MSITNSPPQLENPSNDPLECIVSTSSVPVVKSKKSKSKKASPWKLSISNPDVARAPSNKNSIDETSTVDVELDRSSRLKKVISRSPAINGTVTLRVKDDGRACEVVSDAITTSNGAIEVQKKAAMDSQCDDFVDSAQSFDCSPKKLSLEEFRHKQMMIEEQNKWRRAMLTKAIADRKKRTLAETEKLTHIQTELQKLDSLVSTDVAILRDKIEVASVEFNEIQKRYEKAEREFVDAKTELFQKMERKEKLTEHLCKIIEENELRKAKKLSELMEELELESLRDDECLTDGNTDLPQLSASNDITYAYCTTFRRPSASLTPDGEDRLPDENLKSPSSDKCPDAEKVNCEGPIEDRNIDERSVE